MTSRDFCFWLQGVFEVADPKTLNDGQVELVRRHLALVFKHEIDPSMGEESHQAELQSVHDGSAPSPASATHHLAPWTKPPSPDGVKFRC